VLIFNEDIKASGMPEKTAFFVENERFCGEKITLMFQNDNLGVIESSFFRDF